VALNGCDRALFDDRRSIIADRMEYGGLTQESLRSSCGPMVLRCNSRAFTREKGRPPKTMARPTVRLTFRYVTASVAHFVPFEMRCIDTF
jgi:hypothetical protein